MSSPPLPPLPPPPRRPPPAFRSSSSSQSTSHSSQSLAPSSASNIHYGSKSMRARALVSKLASSTTDYAAPRVSSAKGRLKDAYYGTSSFAESEQLLTTPKKALRSKQMSSSSAEAEAERAFSIASGVGSVMGRSGGGAAGGGSSGSGTGRISSAESSPPTPGVPTFAARGGGEAEKVKTPGAGAGGGKEASRWGGWGNYFYGSTGADGETGGKAGETGGGEGGKGGKIGTEDREQDMVVCFPGWATLSPSPSLIHSDPALILDIYTHGYAYRSRPLASASRSQRIFYALAKSFAALPKLAAAGKDGAGGMGAVAEEAGEMIGTKAEGRAESLETAVKKEALKGVVGAGAGAMIFDTLLDIGRDGTKPGEKIELAEATVDVVRGKEPRERSETEESDGRGAMSDEPEEMSIEERLGSPTMRDFPTHSSSGSPDPHHAPRHASTAPASVFGTDEPPILGSNAPTKLGRRPHVRIDIPKRSMDSFRSPSTSSGPSSPLPRAAAAVAAAFKERTSRPSRDSSAASSAVSSRASSRATSPVASSSRRGSKTPSSSTPSPFPPSTPALSTDALSSHTNLPPETWPLPFFPTPFPTSLLPTFHRNMHSRLLPFLGAKLPSRKIRLTIHPVLPAGQLFDGVLARKVVTTSAPGGGWKTRVQVEGRELKRWLEVTGKGGVSELRVRVEAELLEVEGERVVDSMPGWESGAGLGSSASFDEFTRGGAAGGGDEVGVGGGAAARGPNGAGTGGGGGGRGLQGWEIRANSTASDDAELVVAIQGEGGEGGGVRVISDVDDTIKWTEVVKGTKTIFRNCFVRDLHEIRVPGMASWYRYLQSEHHAHFHYVSNSPWELYPVIRAFLRVAGFPSGSATLKEYGGLSSTITKLWEEPGMRKRANVEGVMREFPASKFLLIGDSGEQDLQLYVSLAQQYPDQVLGIYIRDVTTPFHPPASRRTDDAATPTVERPGDVEWSHSHSAADLASLVKDEEDASSDVRGFNFGDSNDSSTPTSEMPDLPGAYEGAHDRPHPKHASTLPPSVSGSSAAVDAGLAYKPYESKRKLLHRGRSSIELPHSASSSSAAADGRPPIPSRPSLGARALSKSLIESAKKSVHSKRPSQPATPSSSRPPSPDYFGSASASSASSSAMSSRSSTLDSPAQAQTPEASSLYDPDSDALSPNNPPRPSLPPAPSSAAVQTAVEAFYRRVAEAERALPKGVVLRIFRHGEECRVESGELVKRAMGRRGSQ